MNTKHIFLALAAAACAACADTSVWVGGVSTWNKAVNWSPQGVPNSTTAVVRVDGGAGTPSQVTVDISPTVAGLTVDAGDAVTIANARTLTLYGAGGGLTNNGTVAIAASGVSSTLLLLVGGQTIAGAGEIAMSDSALNEISVIGSDKLLTHAASHTIRGAGCLLDNTADMVNYGVIRAAGSAALTVDPLSFFVNAGTLRAEGSGGLALGAGAHTNAGCVIEALSGSRVTVQNGATVSGGTLASAGTGRVVASSGARLDAVTLAAGTVVTQANSTLVTVSGGLANNGAWNMAAGNNTTILSFSGGQTLGGSGELVLSDSAYNRVTMAAAAQTLTHGAGHTIRGAGELLNNSGDLVNEGAILAQGAKDLAINPLSAFLNTGVLRAEGKGGLTLEAGAYTNAGFVIEALDGSRVTVQNGATVAGGTLASAGTGRIVASSGARLDAVTLAAGTVVTQANSTSVTVSGGLANNGAWNMAAGNNTTILSFSGDQALGGSGELVLSDSIYNRVTMAAAAQTLTHGAGHTIRGAGELLNNTGDLVNEGAILAQGAKDLALNPSTSFVNAGVLRAEGAGGLTLEAGAYTNAGFVIEALGGSRVTIQNGATVSGGTLASRATGRIVATSGARLDAVTLAAGTVVTQANTTSVTISGGLVNNGVWNLAAVNSTTILSFSGEQSLSGSGMLVLSDSSFNRVDLLVATQVLSHGSSHTLRGAGVLLNNSGDMSNYGRILAVGTKKLVVNPTAFFRNYSGGILGGTGTFVFTDGLTDNAGTVAPGLSVGTLTIEGDVSNTSSAVLDLELGGAAAGQSDRLVVQGALALDGELRIAFVGGYIPEPEDAVAVISAAGLSGFFANAVPAEGNTAFNVLTDAGTCDVTYDYASSPRTVTVSNMRPDPTLLRAVGVEAATEARVIRFAPSAVDWLYTLQHRPSLAGGDWADVPGQGPRPGIGRRDAMVHTNAPAAGFYRVVGEAAP